MMSFYLEPFLNDPIRQLWFIFWHFAQPPKKRNFFRQKYQSGYLNESSWQGENDFQYWKFISSALQQSKSLSYMHRWSLIKLILRNVSSLSKWFTWIPMKSKKWKNVRLPENLFLIFYRTKHVHLGYLIKKVLVLF